MCIEKSGGCNRMQYTKCKHDLCWVCLGGRVLLVGMISYNVKEDGV